MAMGVVLQPLQQNTILHSVRNVSLGRKKDAPHTHLHSVGM